VPPIDHRRLTLKNALIVVQVAVSVLLLGGTSIFLQQLAATRERRVGYAVDGVAMLETDARFAGYPAAAVVNMYDELLRRIAAVPGVQSAALSYGLPMQSATVATVVEGAASDTRSTGDSSMIWAGPGFFETLRIPLLHGRVFDARDRAGTPSVAVVTETMARQYFGTVDAVGVASGTGTSRTPGWRSSASSATPARGVSPLTTSSLDSRHSSTARTRRRALCRRPSSRERRVMRPPFSGRCNASCAPWTSRCR
jgi:hypothetical protein